MKLLVFAHTPPPHHGQSYMVQLMIEGFETAFRSGDTAAIECFHVNCQVSDDLEDVGGVRPAKFFRLLKFCLQAVWVRLRFGVTNLYYVPAPAKRSAVIRDWIVMLLVRPFFSRTVLHWHAFGLGHWAAGSAEYPSGEGGEAGAPPQLFRNSTLEKGARSFTLKLLSDADLSIVLTEYNRRDAALLCPKRVQVVPNGIPDPCPDFEQTVLPLRQQRLAERQALFSSPAPTTPLQEHGDASNRRSAIFRVLFLAHCTRSKGIFDILDAVGLANATLVAQALPVRLHLTVAGDFMNSEERDEFNARVAMPDLQLGTAVDKFEARNSRAIHYVGFVAGAEKFSLFREADCLCFPTYFPNEAQPVSILEGLAFGLPIVATKWRGIPEMLVSGTKPVKPRHPAEISSALIGVMCEPSYGSSRKLFESRYKLAAHLHGLEAAFRSV